MVALAAPRASPTVAVGKATVTAAGFAPTATVSSAGTLLTTLSLTSTSGATQTNMPFEFMVPIPPSTMLPTEKIALIDDLSNVIPVQEDQRRTDRDGYLRLLKCSASHPSIAAGATRTVSIKRLTGTPDAANPITVQNVLDEPANNGFDVTVTLTFPDGSTGTASAREAIQASSTWSTTASRNRGNFRSGGLCTEMIVDAPIAFAGDPRRNLRCHFHLAFWKATIAAWNASTNPIIYCDAGIIIENGFMRGSSPQDEAYDLLVEVGDSVKTTAYQLIGGAGDTTLTLSATSGVTISATRSGGSWAAASSTPNSNDVGKALVEVSGSGRGALNGRTSGTVMRVAVPSTTAFASTTRTSGQWKKLGVYHYYHTRVEADVTWGTVPAYDAYVGTSWLKTSQMIMNYGADKTSGAPGLTNVNAEGFHPMSMAVQSGLIADFGMQEANTGDADHIGVMSQSFTIALLNWDDATNRANAKTLMQRNALVGNKKPFWVRDEVHGGLPTIDDSGNYFWTRISDDNARTYLTDYHGGSSWFGFANNHTGHTAYLPYLLMGKLRHLEAAIMHVADLNMGSTSYGFFVNWTLVCGGSTQTLSFGDTGEAGCIIALGTKPQISGVPITDRNRYFIRRLTGSTVELYDTYANAMASPATTGRVTFSSNGSNLIFRNGYSESAMPFGVHGGQPRQLAWTARTDLQLESIMPDVVDANVVGRSWNKTNVQRRNDAIGSWLKTTYADDSNFVALGPRFLEQSNGDYAFGPWQNDYFRLALHNGREARSMGSNYIAFMDWLLASAMQAAMNANASNHWMIGGYYLRNCAFPGLVRQYTWAGFGQEMIRTCIPEAHGLWNKPGVTADIASVASQANVTVVLKSGGVEATFFDATSQATLDRHIGTWLLVGSGQGQIKSVSSKGTCVVDCTVANWDLQTGQGINMAIGNGQTCQLPPPSWGNSAVVTGTFRDFLSMGGQGAYFILANSAIEIAKQWGIDTTNYTAAHAHMTGRSLPSNPPSPSDVAFAASCIKANVVART